ncbi:hypothetical protein [Ktedonosporobacter rubrisoli]|nr:hypothetical protein [Ktedonosporobacter rubrisoli]
MIERYSLQEMAATWSTTRKTDAWLQELTSTDYYLKHIDTSFKRVGLQ